jgi:hypothetical protein
MNMLQPVLSEDIITTPVPTLADILTEIVATQGSVSGSNKEKSH